MAKYSEISASRFVSPEVQEIVTELCKRWEDSGTGYQGKQYVGNEQFQLQVLLNSNLAEVVAFHLLQQADFVDKVNGFLMDFPEIYYNHLRAGEYMYNNATGEATEAAHDILDVNESNPDRKGWTDLTRKKGCVFDQTVIWSIEVKNTTSYSKNDPAKFHRADIVFVFYMDTGDLKLLAPMIADRKVRTDDCYIEIGTIPNVTGRLYKTITKDWEVTDFKIL